MPELRHAERKSGWPKISDVVNLTSPDVPDARYGFYRGPYAVRAGSPTALTDGTEMAAGSNGRAAALR